VSVIIPAYRRPVGVRRAIESVLANSYSNCEIIVVDDAADEETRQTVLTFGSGRVRYLPHIRRTLTAEANNDGIRSSNGEIIILASDDLVFAPDAIERFVHTFDSEPRIGWVGAVVYYQDPHDVIQTAGIYLTPFARRLITIGENKRDTGQYTAPYEVTIVDSCTAVPRSVLARTGLVDTTQFPFYHDLASIQLVARGLGYRIIVNPSIKAWHERPLENRQSRALVSPLRSYYMVRSRIFLERGFDDKLHRLTFALSLPLFVGHFIIQALALDRVPARVKRSVVSAMLQGLKDGLLNRRGLVFPQFNLVPSAQPGED
jgi:GT2 family glycosyltransferase